MGFEFATIWRRLINPPQGDFSPDAAREILRIEFHQADCERYRRLHAKSQFTALPHDEQVEYAAYCLARLLLATLHEKAQNSLERARTAQWA